MEERKKETQFISEVKRAGEKHRVDLDLKLRAIF